jgi:hypothetical protein
MTGTGFGNSGRSTAGNFFGRGISPTDLEDYISFTITADTGFTLDLSQLEFDYYVQQDQSPFNSFTFEVRSSVDGFTAATSGTYTLNPATSGAPYEDATFDLTGASYQGLSSIEFRLYAKTSGSEQFNDIVRWDNITVTGTVTSGGGGGGSAFDTWATSNGVPTGSEAVDSDSGGKNNLYEFALGGNPTNGNDDGALLHTFSGNVAGDPAEEGILTILVRNAAAGFVASGNDQVSTADGVTYTVSGDSTLPVAGGSAVTGTAAVTTGLPAAPAGYTYVSFYLSGAEGYFQVRVSAP